MKRLGASVILLAPLAGACRSTSNASPYQADEAPRETVRAEALSREGADLIEADPERAEKLLREALAADLFYGPAHNNLGVIHLDRGELYEAAHEWARKLMPGHPDPRVNLAMTLERAAKNDEAKAEYESALEVWPDYVPAVQGLASLTLLGGEADDRLREWLELVAMNGENEAWREWARGEITRRR